MQSPQAPDWSDGNRALKKISHYLHQEGKTLLTQARMLDDPIPGSILLPGFTPFGAAADWALPRAAKDIEDIVAIYEEYVDRPLGSVRRPDEVAKQAFSATVSNRFFGAARRRPWEWWVPAAQLVAVAAKIAKVAVKVQPTRVLLELDGIRMEVTKRGCWSNFRGRVLVAKVQASDADVNLLTVPSFRTEHPLAKALLMADAPDEILWAANAVLRAEKVRGAAPITSTSIEWIKPVSRGNSARRFSSADTRGAVLACREAMEQGGAGLVGELYSYAVPTLMNRRAFTELVASPWNAPNRVLQEEIMQRLAAELDRHEAGL